MEFTSEQTGKGSKNAHTYPVCTQGTDRKQSYSGITHLRCQVELNYRVEPKCKNVHIKNFQSTTFLDRDSRKEFYEIQDDTVKQNKSSNI